MAFLPRSNHLLISWLQSPSTKTLEPKMKSVSTSTFPPPSICHEVMGPDAIILVFFNISLSLTSFTLIKRLLSSSLFSAISVVSSAYLRLLMFLLPIVIPACNSSSPAFLMMYSVYRLNKQGDSRQPCRGAPSYSNITWVRGWRKISLGYQYMDYTGRHTPHSLLPGPTTGVSYWCLPVPFKHVSLYLNRTHTHSHRRVPTLGFKMLLLSFTQILTTQPEQVPSETRQGFCRDFSPW